VCVIESETQIECVPSESCANNNNKTNAFRTAETLLSFNFISWILNSASSLFFVFRSDSEKQCFEFILPSIRRKLCVHSIKPLCGTEHTMKGGDGGLATGGSTAKPNGP